MAAHIFFGIKRGIFWVILGVLVVAVSLTAQAPKSPTPSQSVSEVGRYVFWSGASDKGERKYGFLDTKRGRVWTFSEKTDAIWDYYDLNENVIGDHRASLFSLYDKYMELEIRRGGDSNKVSEKYSRIVDSLTAEFAEKIRQKEK